MDCDSITTKTIIAMVICIIGVTSIFIVLGLAMLRTIALPGYSPLLLIMLATVLFVCVPFLSMYGTYKYAKCLNDDLMREINEWLQESTTNEEHRGGE